MSSFYESSNKFSEQELGLQEYLNGYAAIPSATNMAFLQHFSRYVFFAEGLISSPDTTIGTADLSETSLKGMKIMDVGCGEGFGSNFLAGLGAEVTGIDSHEAVINHAQSNYPVINLQFTAGDACDLDFPNSCFDAVCAMDLVEHLEFPDKFIAEAKRVLKDNGLLMFSTPNHLKHLIETGKIYPFHEREYLYSEFVDFAEKYFNRYELYGQCPGWINNICESMRQRNFHQAPFLNIAGVKLVALIKKAVPEVIKKRLHRKPGREDYKSITFQKIKASALYQSIRFVKERYETCSDFILVVNSRDIKGV